MMKIPIIGGAISLLINRLEQSADDADDERGKTRIEGKILSQKCWENHPSIIGIIGSKNADFKEP